jgi:AmiR/NasT family two-component response regulator
MVKPKGVRVLIADDSDRMQRVLRQLLELMGYIVVGQAAHGRQAVEMTQALRPDVILTDVQMPDMDGIEAARQIQASCPTPVVVLTAYASPDLLEKASEAGVGAYLTKPPDEKELERAIVIAMARFRDLMELRRLNAELQEALDKVKTLSGLLPICAACKKIRNDGGYWQQVEEYIHEHSNADFTHGICPECARKLYPEYYTD